MYQEKRLIDISSNEFQSQNKLSKTHVRFHSHTFSHILPCSYQFPVHNRKASVGGQVTCDRSHSQWLTEFELKKSSTTVLCKQVSVCVSSYFQKGLDHTVGRISSNR